MYVLFLIPGLSNSGAPKIMTWVANQLSGYGWKVSICTMLDFEQKLFPVQDVNVLPLRVNWEGSTIKRYAVQFPILKQRLLALISEEKPDVVVSFGDLFSCMCLRQIRRQCPILLSERVDPYQRGFLNQIKRRQYRYAHGFVFQTEGAKGFFPQTIQQRSFVIPNPVIRAPQPVSGYRKREKKIVAVGRFELRQKRQDLVLAAFELFHKRHPEYSLIFYGDGPDMERARDMAMDLDAKQYIVFAGAVKPIEDYIGDAAMSVSASDYEGIPNAVIEAMSMGIPVISTDCSPGGARLLLGNENEYGRLVPRGDAKKLAEEMAWIAEHPDEAEDTAIRAQKSLERFDEKVIISKWMEALQSVCT